MGLQLELYAEPHAPRRLRSRADRLREQLRRPQYQHRQLRRLWQSLRGWPAVQRRYLYGVRCGAHRLQRCLPERRV